MTKSHLFYQTNSSRPVLAEARGIYMWDVHGKRYIDGSSGSMVSNIGHSNPRVLDAMRRQMEKSTFGYRLHFETEPGEKLASKVAGLTPEGLEKVFFVSGGSEAVESAIKIARQYSVAVGQSSRWKVISRAPSYHGSTLGALALTSYTPLTRPFEPMMQAMPKIPAPRAYLDGLDPDDPATGAHYAAMLEAKIIEEGPETVLAFIHEPVGGASTGALVPPAGYMQAVRDICDRHGVLLIHDEVMSGGGRTGLFLGADHWGVAPDIIAISKGFGAGYAPLGAMIAHDRIVDPVLKAGGFMHGHTYAGNPLACAAGLAVLEEIEAGGMMQNAAATGAILKSRLGDLMQRYGIIGDVRGKGLLLAFELVADRQSMRPLPRELNAHAELVDLAYEEGLIIYSRRTRDGLEGDHFLVCPPMITTPDQVEEIMTMLTAALDRFVHRIQPALERSA
ncbi:aspartate aminotransferase family protein [Albidovulum sp.]|uniref:aminotransferase family protein n=1 Tax=Albidovulum sp. TaxID=1872424 RepID=UPI001D70477C|nr:aspartate aminotransferase family protein [Paracoccaceae bacterium]HPE26884.1 aspartate aminotransferase family protein [Albidovulum sp.]MCB2153166.1 aspartate aminotransferase family protein [Paracoccaceae bacterium]MCO5126026.1 aspartate aminotransferase family protein [Paracoccaceae bacterium]MCP5324257.1 aspartate aminotransferase family protein [Paracoccaceae bacterium]